VVDRRAEGGIASEPSFAGDVPDPLVWPACAALSVACWTVTSLLAALPGGRPTPPYTIAICRWRVAAAREWAGRPLSVTVDRFIHFEMEVDPSVPARLQ
jgi:hypothetical protein